MAFNPIRTNVESLKNIFSLRNINEQQQKGLKTLTTGLKVKDVQDDLYDYFRARTLNERANEYELHKSQIENSITTIKSAINGLDGVEKTLKQWKAILTEVHTSDSLSGSGDKLENMTEAFYDAGIQMMGLALDSRYNGVRLIDNVDDHMYVRTSYEKTARLRVDAKNILGSSLGLGGFLSFTAVTDKMLDAARFDAPTAKADLNQRKSLFVNLEAFIRLANNGALPAGVAPAESKFSALIREDVKSIVMNMIDLVGSGLKRVRARSKELGGTVVILQNKLSYNIAEGRDNKVGSELLIAADMNLETALYKALETRNQLALNAMSISGRQQNTLLGLLR